MKRKERKKMKQLQDKYYSRMQKINDNYDEFIKQANIFRMKSVEEIGKLMNQDRELQKLLKESQYIWNKNQEIKQKIKEKEE